MSAIMMRPPGTSCSSALQHMMAVSYAAWLLDAASASCETLKLLLAADTGCQVLQEKRAPAEDVDTADTFDISNDKHKGQYALRKLYHESVRPLAVLYTSPTCGPCRTLKPILNSVVESYAGKHSWVRHWQDSSVL